ncbi:hypothetical protein SCHPADRAFT_720956 [Schizopora paradoxa]|uniref:Uncharacterized protein n=1 Tax=Schizopora paradoxa TaxID=27342 RepID=A0A0H2R1I0_9AGAM|nr:hypothetical protein SCHPADRAFT_720956 [Schizopora paradoxa]
MWVQTVRLGPPVYGMFDCRIFSSDCHHLHTRFGVGDRRQSRAQATSSTPLGAVSTRELERREGTILVNGHVLGSCRSSVLPLTAALQFDGWALSSSFPSATRVSASALGDERQRPLRLHLRSLAIIVLGFWSSSLQASSKTLPSSSPLPLAFRRRRWATRGSAL